MSTLFSILHYISNEYLITLLLYDISNEYLSLFSTTLVLVSVLLLHTTLSTEYLYSVLHYISNEYLYSLPHYIINEISTSTTLVMSICTLYSTTS